MRRSLGQYRRSVDRLQTVARWLLALVFLAVGTGHLVFTEELLAQVPTWLPFREMIVVITGFVELSFAVGLVFWRSRRRELGWAIAAYLVIVFIGNVSQAVEGTDLFALDTDVERWGRLALQPVIIVWALWCTGAWPRRSGVTT